MFNTVKFILPALFISFNFIFAKPARIEEPLIIFHFDFNSVSLREDYIYKWLDKIAEMGYTAVLWEIEDDVQWETCPESVSSDAFSKDQFRAILKYTQELGLESIPLLQTIGHAEYVLQNDKYKSFKEDSTRYDCYCTTNPDVRKFIKSWIKEYLNLFGNIRYFHLGGDEAYSFATCSKCKTISDESDENYLFAEYITDISQQLLDMGIRPGIWSDMILKHPEDINFIKREFVIWDWNYWDGIDTPERLMVWGKVSRLNKKEITESVIADFPEIIDKSGRLNAFYTSDALKRFGFDVILCSASRSHGDGVFAGRNDVHTDNIIGAAKKTVASGLLGNCVTSWAVRIHNFETQEPWLYMAPLTIKNPTLRKEELLAKTSEYVFGINDPAFFIISEKIAYTFPFVGENTTGIMWTGMKDGKPAPEKYIYSLIEKWKATESQNKWKSAIDKIKISTDTIAKGISELQEYIPRVKKGMNVLNAWATAGYFQYWQSIIANEIAFAAENKTGISTEEIIKLISNLKEQYAGWAEIWMTKNSAEQNTGLIYNAIQKYFEQGRIK